MRFYIEIFGIVIFKDNRQEPTRITDNIRQETSAARLPKHTEPRPDAKKTRRRHGRSKTPNLGFTAEKVKAGLLEYHNSTNGMKHVMAKREGYKNAKSLLASHISLAKRFNLPHTRKDYKL